MRPHALHPGAIQGKEGIKFCHLATLFRYWVTECRKLGLHIIDRCNLTVLLEPKQQDLCEFLAENEVNVIASLPCYVEDNVDTQRGDEVFKRSIAALRMLNERGYGVEGTSLKLDLGRNSIHFKNVMKIITKNITKNVMKNLSKSYNNKLKKSLNQ